MNIKPIFVIYLSFIVATIATIVIIVMDIDHVWVSYYFIFYAIFSLSFFLYFLVTSLFRFRKKSSTIKRKILTTFILYFISFSIVGIIHTYFFKEPGSTYWTSLSLALGLALGMSLFSVSYFKEKEE
ncbi:hypothetical protein [Alkalihalobacillus trypoxylicola]|uniref:Uncharacterized protein n=1 Tax=Alkalihalobacillus trypoxylicola TaxID=519424 RepID=A0A161P594_9BACI|nr:hypothetical protein [Alkalihalobacillus trypoxylicola]KYG26039.1 hypothetical protein AZF04_13215 [Alkalihalobacillus trypoxylicola]